jgi:hypothetical protein
VLEGVCLFVNHAGSWPMNRVSIPGSSKLFFTKAYGLAVEPIQPFYQMGAGCCALFCKYAFVEYSYSYSFTSTCLAVIYPFTSSLAGDVTFILFDSVFV